MFVLAHLSDPHLAPLPRPAVYELIGKRIGGYINWRRNRRHVHLSAVLARITADLKAQHPDHLAVTGDLVNLSLEAEFAPARAWLERLGPAQDVTVVPGNHDTYVRSKSHHPERFWADYMCGDDPAPAGAPAFPFLRRRGPLALIGLSSAVPAPPFRATGRIGTTQLARFAELAERLRGQAFRVVLIHHPPVSTPARHHERLIDGPAFLDVIRAHGAELILHGHEHRQTLQWLEGPQARVPAVGVPSASATVGARYEPAAYNLYALDGAPGGWRCEMATRGLAPDGRSIVERGRTALAG
jgi:3',5'-cyclic AMP phosphodiesterase CpdA